MTKEEFAEKYCKRCGSIICSSPYGEIAEGCNRLKQECGEYGSTRGT